MSNSIREFADGAALARGLAEYIAGRLRAAVAARGVASFAVSGGRTPVRLLETLASADLPWSRITVTLVDERWVPPASDRSNEGLVRAHLLRGPASAATFVGLRHGGADAAVDREHAERALATMPWPPAVVVLGMGDDGHTASFFPGGDRLADCLDMATTRRVETIRAPAAVEPRLTLTLPALLAAESIALHIEGAGKRAVLERARGPGPEAELPVRAVLSRALVEVFWCP
jgi:6-phosphogluconolactonase